MFPHRGSAVVQRTVSVNVVIRITRRKRFFLYFLYFILFYFGVGAHRPECTGGQKIRWQQLGFSFHHAPGVDLRLSGLVVHPYPLSHVSSQGKMSLSPGLPSYSAEPHLLVPHQSSQRCSRVSRLASLETALCPSAAFPASAPEVTAMPLLPPECSKISRGFGSQDCLRS